MTARPRLFAFALAAVTCLLSPAAMALRVDVLRASGGIPPHIAGQFFEPINFQRSRSGEYYVFDRRGHAVYAVDADKSAARKVLQIGFEEGRILGPTAFDLAPDGTFVVSDAPNRRERIQHFGGAGLRIAGFTLPGIAENRLMIGNAIVGGVGSLQFTGDRIFVNQPETGALVTEYTLGGAALRTFGALRRTGHEADRGVHLALNVGLPLIDPTGGFYFVFQGGEPLFRKYDAAGRLVFERHIEGREIDAFVASLPTTWPRRRTGPDAELPVVTPTVRTAAVSPDGDLWVSFTLAYTYVYDPDGDKVRTVQFQAAGTLSPSSLFFDGRRRLLVTPGLYEFDPRR